MALPRRRDDGSPRLRLRRTLPRVLAGLVGLGAALCVAPGATAGSSAAPTERRARGSKRRAAAPPAPVSAPSPQERDPNAAPPMPAPNGQPPHDSRRWQPPYVTDTSRQRRVQLTLMPSYASFRIAFQGRPSGLPVRGGGVIGELDIRLWRTMWLRLSALHTAHPVGDERSRNDDDELVQTAKAGTVRATGASLGLAYAFDLGRFLPMIDLGLGGLWVRSPDAAQAGQFGGECLDDGSCDAGLVCSSDNQCRVGAIPALHGGFGFDVLLGAHWAVGMGIRYYAVATAPTSFPIFLTGSLRAAVRF